MQPDLPELPSEGAMLRPPRQDLARVLLAVLSIGVLILMSAWVLRMYCCSM